MISATTARALEREKRLRETVARNVKATRKALGLTAAEAAAACGLHLRHVQKIEAGELNITVATLAALSAGLDIGASELMSEAPRAQARKMAPRSHRKKRAPRKR